ncbi:hypothetical protein KC19_VG031100 [Ceratodon purpureus]|uniref:Uncharacterized protein n=1 Tax=Ceratodon purpureus TaxID=3225 RepID=A0A8T0HLI6_CERPU|nr:hypothetical protein KC19_VG031100 [Ceratodon purpureus]
MAPSYRILLKNPVHLILSYKPHYFPAYLVQYVFSYSCEIQGLLLCHDSLSRTPTHHKEHHFFHTLDNKLMNTHELSNPTHVPCSSHHLWAMHSGPNPKEIASSY